MDEARENGETAESTNSKSHSPQPSDQPASIFTEYSLQDILSFSYIYLLCMGMLTTVIYYRLIGINILYYSSLYDVLMSPIIFMVWKLRVLGVLIGLLVVTWLIDLRLKKQQQERDRKSDSGKATDTPRHPEHFFVFFSMTVVLFMFIGGGVGAGVSRAERISSGDFECGELIQFVDGEEVNAYVVGQNSNFVFYVTEGNDSVSVAPLQGNIKTISKLPDSENEASKENVDNNSKGEAEPNS